MTTPHSNAAKLGKKSHGQREDLPWSDDEAWEAVSTRDRSYDGRLFYGVRSTGIYCRPSCPSRLPARKNASYFASADEAEHHGFRSCKRCHPRSEGGTVAEFCIRKAVRFLDDHPDKTITLAALSKHVGMSPHHLQRTFKKFVGVSPREYQKAHRVRSLKEGLQKNGTVTKAIFDAGFGSVRGGYSNAKGTLGMTPGEYRRGAAGKVVCYTTAESTLGRVLIASTADGVCAVSLGSQDAPLIEELKREFPNAQLREDRGRLEAKLDEILRRLQGDHPGLALPLDLHGTAFELKVWKALQDIPPGETKSYTDVANAIGRPTAARAVARACSRNKAAVVIPCHRVVRSDGALSGYRWGVERKRALLQREEANTGKE